MNRVITLHDPVEMCVVLCDLTSVQTYIFEFPAKIWQLQFSNFPAFLPMFVVELKRVTTDRIECHVTCKVVQKRETSITKCYFNS